MRTSKLLSFLVVVTAACREPAAPPALPSTLQMVTTPAVPQFSVTGTAKLELVPDCADVSITITGESARTAQAAAASKAKQDLLMAALAKLGVAKADIKLSGVQLSPVFTYDLRGKVTSRVFRAETRVVVTTRDFAKISDIMDAAAGAGIDQMTSAFRRQDIDGLKQQVRDMALDAALAKAKQMTGKLGVKLGPVVGIAESAGGQLWTNAYFQNVSAQSPSDAAVAVESQALTLEMTVSFQLVPS